MAVNQAKRGPNAIIAKKTRKGRNYKEKQPLPARRKNLSSVGPQVPHPLTLGMTEIAIRPNSTRAQNYPGQIKGKKIK